MTLGPHEDGFLGWASPLEVLSALLLESQLTQAPIYMLQPQVHTILNFCYRAVEVDIVNHSRSRRSVVTE